jgi:hypothetical protein
VKIKLCKVRFTFSPSLALTHGTVPVKNPLGHNILGPIPEFAAICNELSAQIEGE